MENSIIAVKDDKFIPHEYASEQELEDLVSQHSTELFGSNSFATFSKKKVTSVKGISGIPDGFIFDFNQNKFFIIEVELSSHDIIRHISNQLLRFKVAMNNPDTREALAVAIGEEMKAAGLKERDLYTIIKKSFGIVLVIDNISEQLMEMVSVLSQDGTDVLTIPFETFENNSGDQIYKFTTFTTEGLQNEAKKWTFKWSTVPIDLHLKKTNESLKEVFEVLRQRIGQLPGVAEKSRKNWVTYQTSPLKNFCTVKINKDNLEIHLKCDTNFKDEKGLCVDQKRTPAWTFDKWIKIATVGEIDYAMSLITQSYQCFCN